MNLFSNGVIAVVTNLSTPPNDYPIGVDDQLIVFFGMVLQHWIIQWQETVPYFPGLGKKPPRGLHLNRYVPLIIQRFKSYVPATPTHMVSVQWGNPVPLILMLPAK